MLGLLRLIFRVRAENIRTSTYASGCKRIAENTFTLEASEIIADLKSEDEGVRAARIEMIVEQHPVVQHYKKKARR